MAKTKRVALSKKMRFEVFKRDSFKCQYCGRSAPEVVLHVDHIQPVAKDGTNDIFNLITSCADCNGGKGARELSSQEALNDKTRLYFSREFDTLNAYSRVALGVWRVVRRPCRWTTDYNF